MPRFLALLVAMLTMISPALAAEQGRDGLHKPEWLRVTSKDMLADFAQARSEGKLLLVLIEQRGCIYCREMHENVFTDDRIKALLKDRYFPVQFNLHGDGLVVDTDGDVLSERNASRKWGAYSTPTIMLFPPEVRSDRPMSDQAVAIMRGAFPVDITLSLFTDVLVWVDGQGYLESSGEDFPAYYRRRTEERKAEPIN